MLKTKKIIAIVPAAGIGSRMKSAMPKQYLTIGNMTILEHTLNKLLTHPKVDKIVVALSRDDIYFERLTTSNHERIKKVIGGDTRADSVFAALKCIEDDDWVLVHDAARPCVCHHDISQLINAVQSYPQGAILATKVTDTIKRASDTNPLQIARTEDRSALWAAVTPQLFNAGELRACLQRAFDDKITITDEASAVEYCGGHPLLVEGRRDNLKVTCPEDLALATFYLNDIGR